ncbi:MAG: hypothetical protein L6R38_009066, partial [Xanthoria sp. 2 TBL-2021]
MAACSGSMDHSMPRPTPWPKPTSSNPTLATSDTPNHIEAPPIKQLIINPSSTTITPNTEPPSPENLRPQPMPPFLTLPTEIHLLIFERLDSIHTFCLLIQTCKQLHAFWHHNALSICANRATAKSHTDRGCELALSQQQSAKAR